MGAARIAVGAALLLLVARSWAGCGWGAARSAVLLGGACVALYQATFFAAVAETGVAIAAVVALGSAPAFTGVLARAFAGERLHWRWAAATGLACAGVALLVLGGGADGEVAPAGVGLRSCPAAATPATQSSASACSRRAALPRG